MRRRSDADVSAQASRLVLACGLLICAGLVACSPSVVPAPAASTAPTPPFSTAAPAPPGGGDTSVPDATGTFAAQGALERAKVVAMGASAASDSAAVADPANQRAPNTMSKEQESKAMPLAGQANDHSTPTRDKKLVK